MESPALYHLMGAYLHQDYALTGTIEENIDEFVVDTPDLAPALPAEVAKALANFQTEEDLETFVDSLGCQVNPPHGLSYREWLAQIADRVRAATS